MQRHTVWTDNTELFVEFPPLVVGQVTTFAAHLSDMATFKPIEQGTVTVSVVQGGKGVRSHVDAPSQPGIFRPSIQPKATGTCQLWFEIETPAYTDKIVIEGVEVYADAHTAQNANPPQPEDGNAISFLKDQAWKLDWAVAPARRDTVFEVIRTGGRILPSQGDEKVLAAPANGIVMFNTEHTVLGKEVGNGALLFQIGGGGMAENNIETDFQQAKVAFNQAKTAFERKEKLYQAKAVSKAELDEARRDFELAQNNYQNLAANFSNGGKQVKTTAGGFLKNIFVSEGQYVSVGDPLAVLAQNRKLVLQANVPQSDYGKLSGITSANFKTSDAAAAASIADYNGRLLSYGKSVSPNEPLIPVQFEIDNKGELLPGSYAEVFLKIQARGPALVIPVEAIMERYGNYAVYVQTEGERFEKRDITTGASDGKMIEVLTGLSEGEMVVTTGAYQVKMASMSSTVPAHGHAH